MAQLFRSKQLKTEDKNEKSAKKSKKTKADQKLEKNTESIIENFEICFQDTDPNNLSNFTDIILILEEAKSSGNVKNNLEIELGKWLSRIKMFHNPEYQ